MTIAAVVLAAGAGSRFVGTQHKLEALIDEVAVVRRSVQAAVDARLDEVIVVAGSLDLTDLLAGQPVTILHNPLWAGGQSTSLRTAVTYATSRAHEAIVVGLADQPFVSPGTWRTVADAEGPICTATFAGRRRPPVKLDAAVWDLLPVTGDHGARYLIGSRPDLVHEVACEGNPADIDTKEDLARWN